MEPYNLNTPLFKVGEQDGTSLFFTARHAVEGIQVFGGIGSGKTSGSGQLIAAKYLKAGFGGLVLTAKQDELIQWQKYCAMTGRADDLVIVDPTRKNFFNFLDYVGGGKAVTENIVQVLKAVIRASGGGISSNHSDPFWGESLDQLLYNLIDLCKLAYGTVSIQALYDIMVVMPSAETVYNELTAPDAFQQAMERARRNVYEQIDAWKATFSAKDLQDLLGQADYEDVMFDAVPDARAYKFVDNFCAETFAKLPQKTRSTIEFSVSGFLFRLLRDPVFGLFCRHASTITPDDCLAGKIILLNLPVKKYHKIGRDCQIMFKYIWQRAMEECDPETTRRPVFLWADEAQNFLHEHDATSQATARSSRIATVYLSQNLPNYFANMGGDKSKYLVDSFLGTLGTKIFHANGDIETNRFASEIIGDAPFVDTSRSVNFGEKMGMGKNTALKFDRIVRPEHFSSLRTGGEQNGSKVQAYIHMQSSITPDCHNFFKLQFDQNYLINLNS